jgi:hypothetical protein
MVVELPATPEEHPADTLSGGPSRGALRPATPPLSHVGANPPVRYEVVHRVCQTSGYV